MVGMLFHWHIDNKSCAKEELEILLEMFLFVFLFSNFRFIMSHELATQLSQCAIMIYSQGVFVCIL